MTAHDGDTIYVDTMPRSSIMLNLVYLDRTTGEALFDLKYLMIGAYRVWYPLPLVVVSWNLGRLS